MDHSRISFLIAIPASAVVFCVAPDTGVGVITYFASPWLLLSLLILTARRIQEGRGSFQRLSIECSVVWLACAWPVASVIYRDATWTVQMLEMFITALYWAGYLGCLRVALHLVAWRRLPFAPVFTVLVLACAAISLLACSTPHASNGVADLISHLLGFWPGLADALLHHGGGRHLPV